MSALRPDQRTLTGRLIQLVTYVPTDAPGLFDALDAPEVWAYGYGGGPAGRPADVDEHSTLMRQRLAAGQRPYTIRLLADGPLGAAGTIIGTSTLHDAELVHERIHLGWTAYSPRVWGTAVNPECKYLLLKHAFEDCHFERVKIQTDSANQRSQDAIVRLGAVREGLLRHHMLRADGSRRDTVVFSILAGEWPTVKARLEARLI
jgi:N-acetyltransferase